VYKNWVPAEKIITTNLWSSELSKLVANAFLAQRVSSINAISALCEKSGANVDEVAKAIGMDSRIGSRFLKCSVGFGGSCFQKDILNLTYLCESFGLYEVAHYWEQVIIMNDYQKKRFANTIIKELFDNVRGKKIAVFGFAFKKDTGDTRATPAIDVVGSLLEEQALIQIYDPKVKRDQIFTDMKAYVAEKAENKTIKPEDFIFTHSSHIEAARGAHAIAILTEWDEFVTYDYQQLFNIMETPSFIFDGRNLLDHPKLEKIGFKVYSIGRGI